MSLSALARSLPDRVQSAARSFRSVLALPHAPAVAASSLIARPPKGMVPLATVLLLHQVTGSYALAGLTAALVAAGDAASTPLQGRLIDRVGRGWVLIPTDAVHVSAVTALILLARTHAPTGALVGRPLWSGSACLRCRGASRPSGRNWPGRTMWRTPTRSLLQQIVFLAGPLLPC
jgi:MFS family permease